MGWAGMNEYSKEAWAWGLTTVFRGKAVNYRHGVINNELINYDMVMNP